MLDKKELLSAVDMACGWMAFVAQHREESIPPCSRAPRMMHKTWKGALKGEYSAATRKWDMFCPVWHTGQAVVALCDGYRLTGKQEYLESAQMGADFLLRERTMEPDSPQHGLIHAIEDYDDSINISAILECLKGLWALYHITGQESLKEAILLSCTWIQKNAYLGGGHFLDNYSLIEQRMTSASWMERFVPPVGKPKPKGRPLSDDAMFLKAYNLSGDERFRTIFYETVDFLGANEYPSGTWGQYPPCGASGNIHPRQSYWWGLPMYDAYLDTGNDKYLRSLQHCAAWYKKAQRRDGGFIRNTYTDFSTDSFGHATSGTVCAAILWEQLYKLDKNPEWREASERSLAFAMRVQFRNPADENLRGAILEKVLPPDGTDVSPYYLRDLGTIFFVQAAARYLENE